VRRRLLRAGEVSGTSEKNPQNFDRNSQN
jgi:hypothetical protein